MHRSVARLSAFSARRSSFISTRDVGLRNGTLSTASTLIGATNARFVDIRYRKKSTAVSATYDQSIDSFPSIVIGPNGTIIPQGSFAEAQAEVRRFQLSIVIFLWRHVVTYNLPSLTSHSLIIIIAILCARSTSTPIKMP